MKVWRYKLLVIILALFAITVAGWFTESNVISAQEVTRKEAVQLNSNLSLADNLVAFQGKTVTVTLASGQTISGIVKAVGTNLLHLEKISQKEFYDALIPLDRIEAIEARVR